MTDIINILDELASTSSRKEKETIIKGHSGNRLLTKTFVAALDERKRYFFKELPEYEDYSDVYDDEDYFGLDHCIDMLAPLTNREVTGDAAKAYLSNLFSTCRPVDVEVLKRVVLHDLKCGASLKTVNKALGYELVYDHPYMRCSSFSLKNLKKVQFPAISQIKADGAYADCICDGCSVTFMSRSGLEYKITDSELNAYFSQYTSDVFQGELLVLDEDGNILPRKKGNGYLNSDDADIEDGRVVFVVWNRISVDEFEAKASKTPYGDIYNDLKLQSQEFPDRVRLCETRIVNDMDAAVRHFAEAVQNGEEGTILKDFGLVWKYHTSPLAVKLKVEFDCELEIIDKTPGEGKHTETFGSLTCATSDRKLEVNVSGLPDALRKEIFDNWDEWVGKIITVRSNEIIESDDKDVLSLFLPRYIHDARKAKELEIVEVRTDRTEADTLERVQEQYVAAIEAMKFV